MVLSNACESLNIVGPLGWHILTEFKLFCTILFSDKNDKKPESSRVSVSDDDERLKLSSDLSDISDAEDGRINVREHCAQRLFSPDIRTELIVDKTLSPETHSAGPSVPAIPTSLQCRNNSNIQDSKTDSQNRERTAPTQPPTAGPPKPKIWSISEIISSS